MTETSTGSSLEQQPVRDFKFRSAFSLSFADLSPIVGIYTVFAIGLIAAGPAFLWAFPLVLIGQLMVCGVFGNLVSKWPLQGSVYAWSRELIGPGTGGSPAGPTCGGLPSRSRCCRSPPRPTSWAPRG